MTTDTPYFRAWVAGPQCQYPTCPAPEAPVPPSHTATVGARPPAQSSGMPVTGGDAVLLVVISLLAIGLGWLMQACRKLRVRP